MSENYLPSKTKRKKLVNAIKKGPQMGFFCFFMPFEKVVSGYSINVAPLA